MKQSIKKYIKQNVLKPLWNNKGYFTYFNSKVFFPKNSIIFKRAMVEGIYEQENLRTIKSLVRPNTTMFDIGANIGLMAIPILDMNKGIKIISIEPSPNTFPYLKKTHGVSAHKKDWSLINEAIADETGEVDFQLATPENGAYESMLDTNRSPFLSTVKVKCNTIDQIWKDHKFPDISFIKIDIEGADLLALRGGINCIKQCKPNILMEWNSTNIIPFKFKNCDLLKFAELINYSVYALPYFSKCSTLIDLNLLASFEENFLLISNEE